MMSRELGTNSTTLIEKKIENIRVLGISGSSRRQPEMSRSERLLLKALSRAKELGAETEFIRLKDLRIYDCEGHYSEDPSLCIYPCQNSLKYKDDQMQVVYDAVLGADVLILATPIRWNNHSALVQKFLERMNCIENSDAWHGERLIRNKVLSLIVIGNVDGLQHVAGNLLGFFSWLGFHTSEVPVTSWVGLLREYGEDSKRDWDSAQSYKYTQEDLENMIHNSINLAHQLKNR